MTETILEIIEDVGFVRWETVDQTKLAEIMHNLAAGVDNVEAINGASELVANTFLRCCDMFLERGD